MRAIDPEAHAYWLAPLGSLLVILGVAVPHWWALALVIPGIMCLLLACYSRQDGLLLFGPFVKRELTRTVRQHRVLLWRGLVVFLVGLALVITYYFAEAAPPNSRIAKRILPSVSLGVLAFVMWNLANVYLPLLVQFVSGVVTEEREANRLDYYLVTDLRARELILGKTIGKVVNLTAYLVAPLPFAVLYPFLFKIDPLFILVPLVYLALTVMSAIGFSTLASVYSRTTKKASANAMYMAMFYLLITYSLNQLSRWPVIWNFNITHDITVSTVVEAVASGNPVTIAMGIPAAFAPGGGFSNLLLGNLRGYAVIHLLFFFGGVLWACKKLRTQAAVLAGTAALGSTKKDAINSRPKVWSYPVIWKETYCGEFVPRSRQARNIARLMVFVLMILPAFAILYLGFLAPDILRDDAAKVVRFAIPFVAWISFAFTGRITSGLISREREKDTLISLVSTPISPRSILLQKYVGGLLALRGGLLWMLLLTIPACLVGFYPWWAGCLLLFMFVIWSLPLAAFGIMGSATAPTTQKAQMSSGLWFVAWILLPVATFVTLTSTTGFLESPFRHISGGICAIFGLAIAGFAADCPPGDEINWVFGGIGGALVHAAWAWVFLRWAIKRFERECEK